MTIDCAHCWHLFTLATQPGWESTERCCHCGEGRLIHYVSRPVKDHGSFAREWISFETYELESRRGPEEQA